MQSPVTNRFRRAGRIFRAGLGAAATASIASLVVAAANQYGVNPDLALAVAQQESGLNPTLVNSKSGAAGVMQLMPATAASLGVTNIMDPTQNVNAGVQYLAQMLAMFGGNVPEALAAYNWGPGNVSAAVSNYGSNWLSYAPSETQNYVATIAGVTPDSIQQAAAASQPATLTVDPDTGDVISEDDGSVDVASLAPVNGGGFDSSSLVLLGGIAIAAWLASDFFAD